jgi:hypothetical protein
MRLTLLSDGSSDRALYAILRWLLTQHSTKPFEQNWADLRRLRKKPKRLAGRVSAALDLYPCDLLVVHRDAEREPPENRVREIREATRNLTIQVVPAVPVRMTEAWLLFDESAIRRAAGCPNGSMSLELPTLKATESTPDPKSILHEALREASNLSGRRRKRFMPDISRVSDLVDDFSPLRALDGFRTFEGDVCGALTRLGLFRTSSAARGRGDRGGGR